MYHVPFVYILQSPHPSAPPLPRTHCAPHAPLFLRQLTRDPVLTCPAVPATQLTRVHICIFWHVRVFVVVRCFCYVLLYVNFLSFFKKGPISG